MSGSGSKKEISFIRLKLDWILDLIREWNLEMSTLYGPFDEAVISPSFRFLFCLFNQDVDIFITV